MPLVRVQPQVNLLFLKKQLVDGVRKLTPQVRQTSLVARLLANFCWVMVTLPSLYCESGGRAYHRYFSLAVRLYYFNIVTGKLNHRQQLPHILLINKRNT